MLIAAIGIVRSMKLLSDQLRDAIDRCGLSRYRIWKETGIPESNLSRFMSGSGGLSMESVDLIGDLLRLKLEMRGPRTSVLKRGGRSES